MRPDAPRDRSAMVRALYTALGLDRHRSRPRVLADAEELIAAELRRSARLVIVPDAHQLRTTALELLYGLWAHGVPDRFPWSWPVTTASRTSFSVPLWPTWNHMCSSATA
ncbi:hypothetical protein [Streptomyces sp. XD-27]|uniref:hypothetical protein n=1 Tax=Streptomyces sp. XD-27 TaxID=3062779 RepID=UPI0026F45640|nr:hypothetical protein [Streptomyces sp. XD-27]WKX68552.1 hypothetical protein Q3Y56_00030 [Streptomyces sp. XD-27]